MEGGGGLLSGGLTCVSEAAHRWAVSGGSGAIRLLVGQTCCCCCCCRGPGGHAATHQQRIFLGMGGMGGMGVAIRLGLCVWGLLLGEALLLLLLLLGRRSMGATGRAPPGGRGTQALQLWLGGIQEMA